MATFSLHADIRVFFTNQVSPQACSFLEKKKSEIQYKGSQCRLWIAVLSPLISSLNVTDFLIVSLSSRNIYPDSFRSQPVAWFGGIENGCRGVHVWPEPDPVDSKLTLLKVSFKQRQHEVQIWGQISDKCHSIQKQSCGPKHLLSSLFSLSKISMHNKVWGSAEILANFVETIVFVNTLHPLPEAFLVFFFKLAPSSDSVCVTF